VIQVRSPAKAKHFSSNLLIPGRLWGPPSLLSNAYRGSFPGGKARPGLDADHSPHLVPRSCMSRSYTSPAAPPQACCGTGFLFLLMLTSNGPRARVFHENILTKTSSFFGGMSAYKISCFHVH
jgi:hypothetical protein